MISYIFTFIMRGIALRFNWFDLPQKRKVHTKRMPTLGGISLWLGFNVGMIFAFLKMSKLYADFFTQFFGLSIAFLLVLITGVCDDLYNLSSKLKLIIQVAIALILLYYGFEINVISTPVGGSLPLGILSIFISVFWIVGLINAINLLDGLDGLAAGVSGIALFFMFIAGLQMQIIPVVVLSLSVMGAVAGFLPHNFYPAKIFMGNTGSMFLGAALAVISIKSFQKQSAVFTLFVPVMAMALPIIDTFLSIIRRIVNKKPIFKADKGHIHHKLLLEEKTQTKTVLSLYFLTTCFGLIALSFSKLRGLYAFLALILVFLVVLKWLKSWGFLNFKSGNK